MIPSWLLVFKKHFVDFLKEFEIGEFQTWDLKVHQNGHVINDYKLFALSETFQREVLDFESSEFFVGDFFNYDFAGESINIKTYDDFIEIRDELSSKNKMLKYKEVIVNLSQIERDLFRIVNTPASGYYISEKLKNAIEEQKFTGFSFQEIEEMDRRIKVIY